MELEKVKKAIDQLLANGVSDTSSFTRQEEWKEYSNSIDVDLLEKKFVTPLGEIIQELLKEGVEGRNYVEKINLLKRWKLRAKFEAGEFKGNNSAITAVLKGTGMLPDERDSKGDMVFIDFTKTQMIELIKTMEPIYKDLEPIIENRVNDMLENDDLTKDEIKRLEILGYGK